MSSTSYVLYSKLQGVSNEAHFLERCETRIMSWEISGSRPRLPAEINPTDIWQCHLTWNKSRNIFLPTGWTQSIPWIVSTVCEWSYHPCCQLPHRMFYSLLGKLLLCHIKELHQYKWLEWANSNSSKAPKHKCSQAHPFESLTAVAFFTQEPIRL